MRLGVHLPVAGKGASPGIIPQVAVEAERIGLDSSWSWERLMRPRVPIALGGAGGAVRDAPEVNPAVAGRAHLVGPRWRQDETGQDASRGDGSQRFSFGDRVLSSAVKPFRVPRLDVARADQQAVLAMYDVSNLDDRQLVATLTLDGDVLNARLVGTQVRVVTASAPTSTLGRPSTPQMARSLRRPRRNYGLLSRAPTSMIELQRTHCRTVLVRK